MITDPLSALAVLACVAFIAPLVADRIGIPSVILLLGGGVALSGTIDPDEVFGELLFTGVGVGVALLLFEGGLTLNWSQLREGRAVVARLVTFGALLSWGIGSVAAVLVLDVPTEVAILIGAILVVSGPTVVMPLLRVARPREPSASILRWEGILIDPLGAVLAVVVLDAVLEERSTIGIALQAGSTLLAGAAVGVAVAAATLTALRFRVISDHLHGSATLAAVLAGYALANELRPESGLIAATALGMAFANQRRVPVAHIVEFTEGLATTALGMLFVVLGARVSMGEIVDYLPHSFAIAAALVLIGRPLAVLAGTAGSNIDHKNRAFLMVLAPRGVVAAAVASLFAIELEHAGLEPGPMVPVVMTVVTVTVVLAGLTARLAARRLKIAEPKPTGVALIGGGPFAVEFAEQLLRQSIPVIHVALQDEWIDEAVAKGQLVYSGRLDSEDFITTMQKTGVAEAVALSGESHIDTYVLERTARIVGSDHVHGLAVPELDEDSGTDSRIEPKPILPRTFSASRLRFLFGTGLRVRTVHGPRHPRSGWITLCVVTSAGLVRFTDDSTDVAPGDAVVQLGPGLTPQSS